ncbi:unnamed protein product [Diatraea saccharalis]|uniref:Major facilitator superfamily (MFS) profile domain-containing protein n=1 Tax=Diatraea saccharalis TaxID=40085 RepID=A0A9P0G315_9NEOP|nr:unnamed protein product [Diatraea saccharalis]
MEEVKSGTRLPFLRQCFVTAGVVINISAHGAVIGFSAILIPSLRTLDSPIKATTAQESSIASIIGIALIVGNLIMTWMMSNFGRKTAHLATIPPILIGWFVIIMANSVASLIAARFLQGVSMGMLGPLGSIIVAEMTHPKNRGAFLTLISLSLTIGVLLCHSLGTYLTWQQCALVCSFITFTSLLMIIFSPESPSWLISQGRYEEAAKVFKWLRGDGQDNDELESMMKAQQMIRKSSVDGIKLPLSLKVTRALRYFTSTIQKPEFFKPIIIMMLLYTMFQFSGINVISSYAIDIIKDVVGPEANAEMLMVALDIERLICNILAVFLMRTLKRRTVLFGSGFLCILSYVTKGGYVYAKHNHMLPSRIQGQWFPLMLIGIYMFSLTVGISSIPFAISGEIFPLEYRGLGGGLSVLPLSLNFFVAVKCFPVLSDAVTLPITYWLYGGIVTVCLSILYFMLPETKDRTLQEIEDTFRGLSPADRRVSEPLNSKNGAEMMRRCSSHILY